MGIMESKISGNWFLIVDDKWTPKASIIAHLVEKFTGH